MNKREFKKLTKPGYIIASWENEKEKEQLIKELESIGCDFYDCICSYNKQGKIKIRQGFFILIPKRGMDLVIVKAETIRNIGKQESVFLYYGGLASLVYKDGREFLLGYDFGINPQADNFVVVPELQVVFSWSQQDTASWYLFKNK